MRRLRTCISVAAAAVSAMSIPATIGSVSAAEPVTRVIVVPGQTFGPTPYQPFAQHLTARGNPTSVLDLPGYDLRGEPEEIGRAVDRLRSQHPNDKIALVGHSVGGVTARWYLKELGGAEKVDTYIAIGTPQYGSPGGCGQPKGGEVCPGTSYMKTINAGDDTPGDTKYFGIRSEREWVDGNLDGGQCRVTPVRGFAPAPNVGAEHTLEPVDSAVWSAVDKALDGRCDGDVVDDADGTLTAEKSLLPGAPGR